MTQTSTSRLRAVIQSVLFILIAAILLAFLAPAMKSIGLGSPLALGETAALATFALTLLLVRVTKIQLSDIGANLTPTTPFRLMTGFAIGLFVVCIQIALVALTQPIHWVRSSSSAALAPTAFALLTYLLLASREELAFRGFPLFRTNSALGLWPAQILIATLFALEHRIGGYTWTNAWLGAFVGSILFGMAALATRGLAVPIGLHAAYNFGHWVLGEKETPGLWQPIIQKGSEARVAHAELAVYILTFILATAAFRCWQHQSPTRPLVRTSR